MPEAGTEDEVNKTNWAPGMISRRPGTRKNIKKLGGADTPATRSTIHIKASRPLWPATGTEDELKQQYWAPEMSSRRPKTRKIIKKAGWDWPLRPFCNLHQGFPSSVPATGTEDQINKTYWALEMSSRCPGTRTPKNNLGGADHPARSHFIVMSPVLGSASGTGFSLKQHYWTPGMSSRRPGGQALKKLRRGWAPRPFSVPVLGTE